MQTIKYQNNRLEHHSTLVIVGIGAIMLILLLSGCSQFSSAPESLSATCPPVENTPTPSEINCPQATEEGQSKIEFPDGSWIILRAGADIDIVQIADPASGITEHSITINEGRILVFSNLPRGSWFLVNSTSNMVAKVTGSIMAVSFDQQTCDFILDCIQGDCMVGFINQQLNNLSAGQNGTLNCNGNFLGPGSINTQLLQAEFGYEFPPEESTPEPIFEGTATAVCQTQQAQFPGTPCP